MTEKLHLYYREHKCITKQRVRHKLRRLTQIGFDIYPVSYTHLDVYKRQVYINDTVHKTRGFLIASGNIAGEKMHFIVNHWPSRAAASPARERAGEQVRAIKDLSLIHISGCS